MLGVSVVFNCTEYFDAPGGATVNTTAPFPAQTHWTSLGHRESAATLSNVSVNAPPSIVAVAPGARSKSWSTATTFAPTGSFDPRAAPDPAHATAANIENAHMSLMT